MLTLLSTPNYCYNSLLPHSIRKCVHHCRKIEPPLVSFVGATRDVDLDERDFRAGYLLSESWMAIGACTSLLHAEGARIWFPSDSLLFLVPSLLLLSLLKVATNGTKRNAVRLCATTTPVAICNSSGKKNREKVELKRIGRLWLLAISDAYYN